MLRAGSFRKLGGISDLGFRVRVQGVGLGFRVWLGFRVRF